MPSTLICIDSSVFIPALQETDPDSLWLVNAIGADITVVIPRLIVQEVNRNLITPGQVRRFNRLFALSDFAYVVDEPIPLNLVEKYVGLGLPAKGDAFIGAFVEWMNIPYLVSANRHFLRDLQAESYLVLDPSQFRTRYQSDTL